MNRLLLFLMLAGHAVAGAQDAWSGEVVFDVTPRQASESQWDYLPHTVTFETNGEAWRILEQGTSFEQQKNKLQQTLQNQLSSFKQPNHYLPWPAMDNNQALKVPKHIFQHILKDKGLI